MRIIRIATVLALAISLAATAASAVQDPTPWEPIGPDGVDATGLQWSDWHSPFLFLCTPHGYLVRDSRTGVWSDHQEPGAQGREVTAVSMVPRLQHRVLTGRLGADGRGSIEMSFPLKSGASDAVVYAGQAGAVFAIVNRAFYDPILYAGTRALGQIAGAVIASADSGMTWHEIQGHGHHDVTGLFCVYNDELYVSGDAGVMHTSDGGTTWQPRNEGLPAGTVLGLWIDGPAVPVPGKAGRDVTAHLYAIMADGVYHTATDVIQWQRVLDDPAPRQVLVQSDPYQPFAHVHVVTHDGRLLVAVRGTWEWSDLTGSLADRQIVGLRSEYPHLVAATANDGVYRSSSFTDVPDVGAVAHMTVAPNPFNPRTVVNVTLPGPAHVQVVIHDARGREVRRLAEGSFGAGSQMLTWDGTDQSGRSLPSGLYLCRLVTPWGVQAVKLSLVR